MTLNTIVTYTIDKTPCIRVKRIKAPQFLTEKERAVSRTLDEYVEIARTEHPTVAFSLTNLIRHIFSNLNLNDVDRNQLCNRILQHCKRHVLESESLTNCMCYIISNQISTSHKILELLNQAVSANRRTVQITPKHDLKQEIASLDNYVVITNNEDLEEDFDNIEAYNPNILKIVEYFKDKEPLNPHAVNPDYLKLTEAEESKLN